MNLANQNSQPNPLVAATCRVEIVHGRCISDTVLTTTLHIPTPTRRLLADWQRDAYQRLFLEPGDVEELSLSRTRLLWPEYRLCTQAVNDWADLHGLSEVVASSAVSLMICRGARYHHDGAQYGSMAFCNLFLSDDKGLDLHFPHTGHRIPLKQGTVVLFDPSQPHGVVKRGSSGFNESDFPVGHDCNQVFLTWELPIQNSNIAQMLQISLDATLAADCENGATQDFAEGSPSIVCPESGQWLLAESVA